MTSQDFSHVIERLQKKDMSALRILYESYFQRIYKTAISIVHNKDDAYDIAMNVILKLVAYKSDPYAIKNHIAFLIAITKNEAYDNIRKESRHINQEAYHETAVANSEDNLWIENILNVLTDFEKLIFIEHCIWDKKLKFIAKENGRSYITVKRAYAIIKDKIKQIYK